MDNNKLNNFRFVMHLVMKYFKVAVIAALALVLLSGVYRVESNELAVVLRFGQLVGDTPEEQIKQPGLHLSFPYIIDEVIKVPSGKVQEITITTHCGSGAAISPNITVNGYIITGDSNIVLLKTKVKYTVSDVVQYALYQNNIERTIDGVVSGEVTALTLGLDVDSVLTSGKAKLSEDVKLQSQTALDELNSGVKITSIEFTEVMPPAETKRQFEEVNIASVKKETMIKTAEETAARTLLEAESQSRALVQTARSNQSGLLSRAHNEVAEFDGLFNQYVLNPNSVNDGIFRIRVSKLLANMGATIVVPEGDSNPIIILP